MLAAMLAVLAAWSAQPDMSGEWQRYFAVFPVEVDAYDVTEIKNGKFRYAVRGWVDRRWHTWTDDETGERHEFWRYRLVHESQ